MRKKLMAALLSFALVLGCVACGDSAHAPAANGSVPPPAGDTVTGDAGTENNVIEDTTIEDTAIESSVFERGTTMSLENEGSIAISRNVQLGDVPMGKEGTWTVFVYLCGSDLESAKDRGFATLDIQEMLAASTGEDVRFVIQTGGSNKWCNDVVEASELGRYEICNGSITKIEAKSDASMGNVDTLADFLGWGVANYPAANMGVVFWNHGGGSVVGVCVDEKWDRDRLYLTEIDTALSMVSKEMTDKFEFIGFDACLMATVENANILAPYANYMYASEETEAGYGWDYTAIGNYLGTNPDADGEELGKVVCDSFFDMLEQIDLTDNGTLSVTDLSKLDQLLKRYHLYAKDLDAAAKDLDVFTLVVRNLRDVEWFGNNSKATGYTNMVDLAGVVSAGEEYSANASQVLEAINEAVVYVRKGSLHEDSCGLSTYYPLAFNGKAELEVFGDIAVSPYYLSFVTRTAYGLEHNGDMSGYVEEEVVDVWSDTWSGEDTTGETDNYWDNYANTEISGKSQMIQFEQEPIISDVSPYMDGDELKFADKICYLFKPTEESAKKIAAIYINKWMLSPDGKYLLELGNRKMGIPEGDRSNRSRRSGFYSFSLESLEHFYLYGGRNDGMWEYSKFDGRGYEPIATYFINEDIDDESQPTRHYMVPLLVNDEVTYLHMTHKSLYDCNFEGRWDGLDADGIVGRELGQLDSSDVVTPIYNAISLETGEETVYCGTPLKYRKGLPTNVYRYVNATCVMNIEIIDVFGNSYMTDYVYYEIVDGETIDYGMME